MALAAFFAQAHPGTTALDMDILDPHPDHSSDAGEGIDHDCNQGAVPQGNRRRNIEAVQQLTGFTCRERRRLAFFHHMLGSKDRAPRVDRRHLANNQSVKEHPDCGEL